MAQSPEYPHLKWVPPRSWTNANRTSVQLIVIHTTEGSSHANSAEDGAAYDQRRTDGVSAHYYVDSDSVIQCVHTADIAHTAMTAGNRRGIHYELCGRASWSAATWRGEYALAMLRRAAAQVAIDARDWKIPVRYVSSDQVRNGVGGLCGHREITYAFKESTHTDPGPNFPWDLFLGMVKEEQAKLEEKEVTGEMTPDDVVDAIERRLADKSSKLYALDRSIELQYPADTDETPRSLLSVIMDSVKLIESLSGQVAALREQVEEVRGAVVRSPSN